MKKILVFIISLFIFTFSVNAKEINIHLFYGNGCPHCANEEKFLEKLIKEDSDVKVYMHEVWYDYDNQQLWSEVQNLLNKPATGVPYTVIGNQVVTGYSEPQTVDSIKKIINYYKKNNYRDLVGELTGIVEKNEDIIMEDIDILTDTVYIPLLGNINPKEASLSIIAIVVGFIDGFNPCAMWILLFLISMLIGMKDRKKMWILGVTFLITSALVYFMFMVAWLNLAVFVTKIFIIRLLISTFAVVFGVINIKKYFDSKKDGCEIVDDKKRKKIIIKIKEITTEEKKTTKIISIKKEETNFIEKLKNIVKGKGFIASIFGVIALAASVNLIELLCSAGLPLMFTNILAINNLDTFKYIIYILIYILFYLLDDLIIFTIAMITFKVTGISTKYTKYSHLVGGIIIILIGLLLLFKPEILMFNI